MRVRLHPAASSELHEAADWYALHAGRHVAMQFISAYEAVRSRVLEYPQIGTPARAATRKLAFPRFPYSLIYRLAEDDIVIVAIAHHHRRPGYWGRR